MSDGGFSEAESWKHIYMESVGASIPLIQGKTGIMLSGESWPRSRASVEWLSHGASYDISVLVIHDQGTNL